MQAAIERLTAAAHPKQIILFGSQARGDVDDRSDVDLLVIKTHVSDRYQELVELDQALAGIMMPVDVLLVSDAEFEERASQPGTVDRAAQQEGRIFLCRLIDQTSFCGRHSRTSLCSSGCSVMRISMTTRWGFTPSRPQGKC
jgi:predicted nucleotidyltransferase